MELQEHPIRLQKQEGDGKLTFPSEPPCGGAATAPPRPEAKAARGAAQPRLSLGQWLVKLRHGATATPWPWQMNTKWTVDCTSSLEPRLTTHADSACRAPGALRDLLHPLHLLLVICQGPLEASEGCEEVAWFVLKWTEPRKPKVPQVISGFPFNLPLNPFQDSKKGALDHRHAGRKGTMLVQYVGGK